MDNMAASCLIAFAQIHDSSTDFVYMIHHEPLPWMMMMMMDKIMAGRDLLQG